VDTECGCPLLAIESEPQQDLVSPNKSGQFIPNTSVKLPRWLKPDFPFTKVVFQECSDIIHSDPLKPPNATAVTSSAFHNYHDQKTFHLRDDVISAGHDHQTPPIFVTSKKDSGWIVAEKEGELAIHVLMFLFKRNPRGYVIFSR
ncbi:MAG: hypothetical protein EBX40_05420, partial [Gammaproteobacteria bacterium]|nr:hypothetical protein [Gammaproteobacteria bacterium]